MSIPAATQVRGTVTGPLAQNPTRFPEHAFVPPAPAVLAPPAPALAPPPPRPLPAEPPTLAPPTLAPLTLAPPTLAPPTLAPPTLAPPTLAPPTLAPPTLAPPTLAPPTLAPPVATAPAAPPLELPPAVSAPAEPVGSTADTPPQAAPVMASGSGALNSTSRRMRRRKWRSFMSTNPCTARASAAIARYIAIFATKKPVSHNESALKLAQIEPASGHRRQPSAAQPSAPRLKDSWLFAAGAKRRCAKQLGNSRNRPQLGWLRRHIRRAAP